MLVSLSSREKAEFLSLLQERARRSAEQTAQANPIEASLGRYVPHAPTPKQREFLSLDCKEALYGGAAGGGKSDALLMAALQYVHVPGYAAILFRKTFMDLSLPEGLIPRSHEWLAPTDAKWDQVTHTWTFPSGAKLTFGYMDSALDQYRYQGAAFSFIGWDELTQFEEEKYVYLFSRLRATTGSSVPLRVRAASNPGGVGHRWVKRRFIDVSTKQPGAVYIPAKLSDNPHLRSDYAESLSYLDAVTRARYLEGDWSAVDDNRFVYAEFDRIAHVMTPPAVDISYYRLVVGGIDPGTRDPYAVGVWALDWAGNWWGLDELYLTGQTSTGLANAILTMQAKYQVSKWFVDKRRPSDIIDLRRAGVKAYPNIDIHGETDRDTIRPMISVVLTLLRNDQLKISPKMKWHLYEFEHYMYKEAEDKNAGEVPIDKDNHAADSCRYAICSVADLPADRRQRIRQGADLAPRPRPGTAKRPPWEPVPIPTAQDYLLAQEKRFDNMQKPGRRVNL